MKKMLQRLKNQKGLTLVELLVVLVIIAIIAAIAIPFATGLISDSEERADAAEALNIISSAKLAETAGVDCSGGCDAEALSSYITVDGGFTVTGSAGSFEVEDHAVNDIEDIGTPASEEDIQLFLNGETAAEEE